MVEIFSASYKADYRLIPRELESTYCKTTPVIEERILPRTIEFPPLLREFIVKETGNTAPILNVKLTVNREKIARLAKEGETPNMHITMNVGKPCSPRLYKGLNL